MTNLEWQELTDAICSHDEQSAAPLLEQYRAEHPMPAPTPLPHQAGEPAYWQGNGDRQERNVA